jgi:hypothetical protein
LLSIVPNFLGLETLCSILAAGRMFLFFHEKTRPETLCSILAADRMFLFFHEKTRPEALCSILASRRMFLFFRGTRPETLSSILTTRSKIEIISITRHTQRVQGRGWPGTATRWRCWRPIRTVDRMQRNISSRELRRGFSDRRRHCGSSSSRSGCCARFQFFRLLTSARLFRRETAHLCLNLRD